jgi:hypothetical protein
MSLERRKTTEQFIKESKNKWGDKYDYNSLHNSKE